ncbi:hypothetical protein C1H46_020463, partial [Malus baccata]
AVVPITCFILLCLFALQHYGTHRIGFLFVVLACLLCISALGLYNIIHWNRYVYHAPSPYYLFKFLRKTRISGWMSLGGILLCITGSEAMFADLGHFSYNAIQHHHSSHWISFYVSVPETVRWPVLVLAILASVVGSQAIISGTFSIINQSQSLSCFPRVKVVHTSDKVHGQIYIPEINWMLMILCIAVTIGFRDTKHLGNASALGPSLGIARVLGIGLVFTDLTSGIPANFSRFVINLPAFHRVLVFVCVKSVPVPYVPPAERYWWVALVLQLIGPTELVEGLVDFIRYEWCRTQRTSSCTEDNSSRSTDTSECRLAVIGTVAFSGAPAYEIEETQPASVSVGFPTVESITEVIEMEPVERRVRFAIDEESQPDTQPENTTLIRKKLEDLYAAQEAGTAFILGNSHVKAKQGSSFMKRFAINFGYNCLRRNCRGPDVALKVLPESLLEVGMVYVV